MGREVTGSRRWTRLALLFYGLATAALVWPIYPALGNRVEPRLLGLPFSLTYVMAILVLSTVVLAALYRAGVVDCGEVEDADGLATGAARAGRAEVDGDG